MSETQSNGNPKAGQITRPPEERFANHPVTADDGRKTAAENFLGLGEDIYFEDAVARTLAAETAEDSFDTRKAQEILAAHGVTNIDPRTAPSPYYLKDLSEQDWEIAKNSQNPFLTLHAAANYRKQVEDTEFIPIGRQWPSHDDPRRGFSGVENRALMRSLPLVHGLSAAAFVRLAENGTMQSNKTRYKESGNDALTFHGAGVGQTNLQDRELGLDQYVFFDFGRPASYHSQQEVTLVVDQSVMDQPGVFMTERDIADTLSTRDYLRGLSTPEYFREAALLRIHNGVAREGEERTGGYYTGYSIYNTLGEWREGQDSDFNNLGGANFSTFEVKIPDPPGVEVASALRRVIIQDQATFERLRPTLAHLKEVLGDKFDYIVATLRKAGGIKEDYQGDTRDAAARDNGNYTELLRVPGAFEQRLEELIDDDYQRRIATLDSLPPEEKEKAIIVFGGDEPELINGQDVQTRITYQTNPYLSGSSLVATYASMEDLVNDVASSNDFNAHRSVMRQPLWFRKPYRPEKTLRTQSGQCVIATVERSKQNPRVTRIVEMRPFGLDELMLAG